MTNEDIDFLVRGIDSRQAAITATVVELNDAPNDLFKINRLLEQLGEASGEMAFLREKLLEARKPIRKFAILTKSA